MKPFTIRKIFRLFELRRKLQRIRFIALDHISEVLLCKTCQRPKKKKKKKKEIKKAIPLGNLGFVSCRLLHLSVEAVRIMAVDLLIFQRTWHGEASPLALPWEMW